MSSWNLRRSLVPLGLALLLAGAFRAAGWPGVAAVGGGVLMWLLLHFTRLVTVMRRTANRPIGHVDSAVMLNARLRCGAPLLQVLALTRALGELLTPLHTQPERFRWTDTGASQVTCDFRNGRLIEWQLVRPPQAPQADNDPGTKSGSARHEDGAPVPGGICQSGTLPP